MGNTMENTIDGRFWLSKEEKNFLGKGRIELLKLIEQTGSINKAAKTMKMSYKAAWDAIDSMNNLAEAPLVERSTGGKGGGGTKLTAYAKEIITTFEVLHEEHERFMRNLSLRINDKSGHMRLLERMQMRISARNQLFGKVIKIYKGAVNCEVVLALSGGDTVTSIITNDSMQALDLAIDTELYALFKAGSVIISSDLEIKLSTKNRFQGTISRITRGSVNAEVVIQLKGTNTITSTITIASLDAMQLREMSEVIAFCKASSVILGIQ